MDKIKIVVATHKKAEMPKDRLYLPLFVGAALKPDESNEIEKNGYNRDDLGENISEKNENFGSQTALYWAWKNLKNDYIGLVHYRRFFINKKRKKQKMTDAAIKYNELLPMISQYKVFVPRKRHYYIETIYSHYTHAHGSVQLDYVKEIIRNDFPQYLSSFELVMNRRWGYMFNLMILRRDLLDDYCEWLFKILFKLVDGTDQTNMSTFEKRFCGRISERLFDVWLEYKIKIGEISKEEIKELPYIEDVNWPFKIKTFLMAKFFYKKQIKSS